jgi:hypothetical protein
VPESTSLKTVIMNEFKHRPVVKIHSHSPLADSDAKGDTLGRFGANDGRRLGAMADVPYGELLTRELSIIIYYHIFADVSNFEQTTLGGLLLQL